jgi:DNA-binding MarR family transcriptional regulator
MTRAYALQRLLQHGAMTRSELREVTGWSSDDLDKTIKSAVEHGYAQRATMTGCHRYVYRLPADHFLPVLA